MIYKESTFGPFSATGEPVVRLLSELPNEGMEKTAGIHPEILAYKNQLEPEPGKTYVHILALGAGDYYGPNLNNDHFPWEGLCHDHTKTPHPHMHGYKTFLNAHAFAHHVNKDPEKAYGDVLLSVLNHKMKRVELIVAIDEEKCIRNGGQRTLEKIKAGEYPSTSMGCRVPFDVCSICGHKAKYRREYCDHMRNYAGKIMGDGRKVFVYNNYPRFFDISFVFIGADRTSFVLEKVANLGVPNIIGGVKMLAKNTAQKAPGAINNAVKSTGGGALIGATTGAVSGAAGSDDGHRLAGAIKGGLAGATTGAISGKLGGGGLASSGVGMMAGQAMASKYKPPEQQAKVASAGLGKSLRKASGTVSPFTGMRVKKKVSRQSKNLPRPITFGKLNTSAKKSKRAAELEELAKVPAPLFHFNFGDKHMIKQVEKEASLKSAQIRKISEMFKDVDSFPMGRAVPMLANEPDMPVGMIDRLARTRDFGQTLSSLGSAGIVMKPHEFQRAVLIRSGQSDLADHLHNAGQVFQHNEMPVRKSVRIVISSPSHNAIPAGIMDVISTILKHRSSLTPFALRRSGMPQPPARIIVRAPMLDKVASLYNGYREDLLMNSQPLMQAAVNTPMLIKSIKVMRGGDYNLEDENSLQESLSHIPMAYFSHAYWNRCCCDSNLSDKEFAEQFTENNPQIAKFLSSKVAINNLMS
tara:strand:- start:1364 stop:3448 length:2085 start_codon:yes stop_codon:yes gene_type:complete